MYIPQPYPPTLQQSFQVMSIPHQHIYSTYIYSQNYLQHILNTKICFEIYIFPNHAPEGHTETTQLTFITPSVGMIYPIPTYIFNGHIFPKLLAAYIQYPTPRNALSVRPSVGS